MLISIFSNFCFFVQTFSVSYDTQREAPLSRTRYSIIFTLFFGKSAIMKYRNCCIVRRHSLPMNRKHSCCISVKSYIRYMTAHHEYITYRIPALQQRARNTVETLYSTIYYSKYFIELNFDKSTQYVVL